MTSFFVFLMIQSPWDVVYEVQLASSGRVSHRISTACLPASQIASNRLHRVFFECTARSNALITVVAVTLICSSGYAPQGSHRTLDVPRSGLSCRAPRTATRHWTSHNLHPEPCNRRSWWPPRPCRCALSPQFYSQLLSSKETNHP